MPSPIRKERAMTLASLLTAHPFADDEALLCTLDGTVSAGVARLAAAAVAAHLQVNGVAPGQAVAVRLPNGPDAVTAMFGVWQAGAVFVPVNVRATDAEVASTLAELRPAAMLDADGVRRLDGEPAVYEDGTAFVTW